jgi:hypothetical protein
LNLQKIELTCQWPFALEHDPINQQQDQRFRSVQRLLLADKKQQLPNPIAVQKKDKCVALTHQISIQHRRAFNPALLQNSLKLQEDQISSSEKPKSANSFPGDAPRT